MKILQNYSINSLSEKYVTSTPHNSALYKTVGSNLRIEMQTFRIQGKKLISWNTFHSEFKKELNFPDYYGKNMDAWIDCIDELTDKPTLLKIENSEHLKKNSPELLKAILECGAFVNHRRIESGEKPNLIISIDH